MALARLRFTSILFAARPQCLLETWVNDVVETTLQLLSLRLPRQKRGVADFADASPGRETARNRNSTRCAAHIASRAGDTDKAELNPYREGLIVGIMRRDRRHTVWPIAERLN